MMMIILKHSDDTIARKILADVDEFATLMHDIDEKNLHPERAAVLKSEALKGIVDKYDELRVSMIDELDSEIDDIKKGYIKKVESPQEIEKRERQYDLEYRSLTTEQLKARVDSYGTGRLDAWDRVEHGVLIRELTTRGELQKADEFRHHIESQRGGEPWLRMCKDKVERRDALRKCEWGAFPVHCTDEHTGKGSYIMVDIGHTAQEAASSPQGAPA